MSKERSVPSPPYRKADRHLQDHRPRFLSPDSKEDEYCHSGLSMGKILTGSIEA